MRDIFDGEWVTITSQEDFDSHQSPGKPPEKIGDYQGPGQYWKIEYESNCMFGCCHAAVCELRTAAEVIKEISPKAQQYSELLGAAGSKLIGTKSGRTSSTKPNKTNPPK
jgi:hypothetical protein